MQTGDKCRACIRAATEKWEALQRSTPLIYKIFTPNPQSAGNVRNQGTNPLEERHGPDSNRSG
jgi:hypothetical protein